MEILVAMDGTRQIDPSMATYLQTLFGISVESDDPKQNPFVTFPTAQTVVVENVSSGESRDPISLLIKRDNKRKVNSQRWWIYGHARDAQSEFVFATDCGIVFDQKCLLLLLERMIRQPNCNGLTGYQRVMPAQMQGDGSFEIVADPMGFFLRQLQSYDFEVRLDQSHPASCQHHDLHFSLTDIDEPIDHQVTVRFHWLCVSVAWTMFVV